MPLCFEVRINDESPLIAGLDDISVLLAAVSFASAHQDLDFRVGGLRSKGPHDNEHVEWIHRDLSVGDRISIQIVNSELPMEPVSRERRDPRESERDEREYYEQLKKKYEPE
jgi:hypothetical protein